MQTFTGVEYLKIDIASNFGLNRKTWNQRIEWFDEFLSDVSDENIQNLMVQAKEPALFYAGCLAYRKALQKLPVSYPISLDGTASGIQILSLLSGCVESAFRCNVVSLDEERKDVYQEVFNRMLEKLGKDVSINYDDVKKSVMTSFYSSIAVPRNTFGEGSVLLDLFYETVEEMMPGAWELNKSLLAIWQKDKKSHDWVLPDNFHVKVKVMRSEEGKVTFLHNRYVVNYYVNDCDETGRSLPANITHSVDGFVVRELVNRASKNKTEWFLKFNDICKGAKEFKEPKREKDILLLSLLDQYEKSNFFSVRILDCIDRKNIGLLKANHLVKINELILSLPEKSFEVLPTHDCFRVLPNYGNQVRKLYNQVLHEIGASDLLQSIVSQITGRQLTVNKPYDFKDKVLHANYALS